MFASIALLQGGSPTVGIIINIVAFAAIFWFLLIRPQRKAAQKHQAMLAALQKGDEVVTEGGIIGAVAHIADDRVTIRTAESTRIVIARTKISRVLSAPDAGAKP